MHNILFPERKTKLKLLKRGLIRIGKLWYLFQRKSLKKEIYFFFPWYQIGGGERVHSQIVSCLNEFNTCVIFTDDSKDNTFLKTFKDNSEIIDLKRNFYNRNYNLLFRWIIFGYLSSMINENPNSITFGAGTIFYYELLPLLNENIKKIDLVHQFGSSIEYFSLPYVPLLSKRVVITDTLYRQFQELYHQNYLDGFFDRIVVIENGVVIPEQYPEKNRNERIRVLFVSRNSPEKRPNLVGRIAYECSQRAILADIICIGDLQSAINVEHRPYCTILGSIQDTSILYDEYRKSDILLIVSKFEGFPMAIMEAMAFGVIPISTDVGGISEHIESGTNGFLIHDSDEKIIVSSILERIQYLEQNRKELEKISHTCYEYAKNHFSTAKFDKEYREMINQYTRDSRY